MVLLCKNLDEVNFSGAQENQERDESWRTNEALSYESLGPEPIKSLSIDFSPELQGEVAKLKHRVQVAEEDRDVAIEKEKESRLRVSQCGNQSDKEWRSLWEAFKPHFSLFSTNKKEKF